MVSNPQNIIDSIAQEFADAVREVDRQDERLEKMAREIGTDILDKYEQLMTCIFWDEKEWAYEKGFPIGLNIMKEGIILFTASAQNPASFPSATPKEAIARLIAKGRQKLNDMLFLYDSGHWQDLSRDLYYGVFHVMSATLFSKALHFSKHQDIIAAFCREFIQTGVFPAQFDPCIARLFERRFKSEYDLMFQIAKEDAAQDIADAEMIVNECENYLRIKGFL